MSDNPFAAPSGDPPPRPPAGGPDWEDPSYRQPYDQSPWGTPPYQQGHPPGSRFVPRSLVTACHVSAAGAWTFTIVCGLVQVAFTGENAGWGILLVLAFGAVLATAFMVGLAVMVVGLVAAVPLLAIWWGERRERTGEQLAEKAAMAHLGVAWLFAGWYLFQIFG